MTDRSPPLYRLAALAVAILAMAALRAQFDSMEALGPADRLWQMAGYFTVLTNALVAGHMLAVALHWRIGAARAAGLLVSIGMVALIFHLILAPTGSLQGWGIDLGMHSGVPLAYALWWAVLAPKGVSRRDLPLWLLWPTAYAAYALTRGALTGFWPYPFFDADALGWPRVALNLAGLLAGFTLAGLAVLAAARALRR